MDLLLLEFAILGGLIVAGLFSISAGAVVGFAIAFAQLRPDDGVLVRIARMGFGFVFAMAGLLGATACAWVVCSQATRFS